MRALGVFAAALFLLSSPSGRSSQERLEVELRPAQSTFKAGRDVQVEVVLRNPRDGGVRVLPQFLPQPWKDAVNFPASVIYFEAIEAAGKPLPWLGDEVIRIHAPPPADFCSLLFLPKGGSVGRVVSLSNGWYSHGLSRPGTYKVRAHYFSRVRDFFARKRSKSVSAGDLATAFNGEVVSAWATIKIE